LLNINTTNRCSSWLGYF